MTRRSTVVRRLAAAVLVGGVATASFSACSGGDDPVTENKKLDDDGDGKVTPEEVMAGAKAKLDDTSGVQVSLSTDDEPSDGDYLASAEGVIIADPAAFDGEVAGRVMGVDAADIPVISADGTLYVKVPVLGWQDVDPNDFCAPDPAQLLDPEKGVSPLLTATEDLEAGDSELGGDDNKETLTPFTGTLPGDAVRNILPCAKGDTFDATYRINSDGELTQAEITGEFFSGEDAITYTIDVEDYGVEQEISAPE
ncbi:LppX_LprAFG lipoprotein [Nocardioides humilatus]|uniref:LppX_LprAFG lipoprotein n=1 Tax=Nocardioides humilatus TaxID=2607660 RepID=A0A5B1L8S2_9ACTN|nr:LppX_LprAFG lipoprotein [Nocardioides humilatus]KAA1416846.1 LppX_LprAFG lipoprotein [Nocardioides humilatus]